jgi:hypothetical protein
LIPKSASKLVKARLAGDVASRGSEEIERALCQHRSIKNLDGLQKSITDGVTTRERKAIWPEGE